MIKWSHARRAERLGHLSLSWVGADPIMGIYRIYQGRPVLDSPKIFVYRLVTPDNTSHDFKYIKEAKAAAVAHYVELDKNKK